jgi:putative transposase
VFNSQGHGPPRAVPLVARSKEIIAAERPWIGGVRPMPQSFAQLYIHAVFSTKERATLIDPSWEPRLYDVIGGILKSVKCSLLAAGGVEDHVHLLISLARDVSVSDALRNVKTDSSKWIHETFPSLADFHWQTGYSAFSVSQSQLGALKRYIANQKEHHRKQSYQDEVRQLLRLHGLESDEEHMWS